MVIDVIFLDLDDTVYPPGNGIWDAISQRINGFMMEYVGLSPEQAEEKRAEYLLRYGTSLTGLMVHHGVNPTDYLAYVHNIELDRYLRPDPRLLQDLTSLRIPVHIFTNASRDHAGKVLSHLGIESAIDSIIAIEDLEYVNKPDPRAFQRALQASNDPDPDRCLLIDDRLENLRAAAAQGWKTGWIGHPSSTARVDYAASDLTSLLAVIREDGGIGTENG